MKKLILAAVAAASLVGVAAPAAKAQPYWGYRHVWVHRYWGPGPYAAYWGPGPYLGPYYGPYWRHRYWGYRRCYRCRW